LQGSWSEENSDLQADICFGRLWQLNGPEGVHKPKSHVEEKHDPGTPLCKIKLQYIILCFLLFFVKLFFVAKTNFKLVTDYFYRCYCQAPAQLIWAELVLFSFDSATPTPHSQSKSNVKYQIQMLIQVQISPPHQQKK
jgi:hypothetical protein